MTDPNAEIASLKSLHPAAVLHQEGGKPVVLLPRFSFPVSGQTVTMDLLLHPSAHSGYVTRLFFEQHIPGRGVHWRQYRLLERMWWAPSFKDVRPDQPWTSMLFNHLKAVE